MTDILNPFQLKDHERFNPDAQRLIHEMSAGHTSEEVLVMVESLVVFAMLIHVQPQGDNMVLTVMGENIAQRLGAHRANSAMGRRQ